MQTLESVDLSSHVAVISSNWTDFFICRCSLQDTGY